MKYLCTILLTAALLVGSGSSAQAQSITPGTYQYAGLASNGQAYTITAVVSATGLNFQEAVLTDVLCTATMQVESIDPTGTIFTYTTTTPGESDCTIGQSFIFTVTPVTTVLEFRKGSGPSFLLNLQ